MTYGYGNGTALETLRKYYAWILKRTWLYPGEGGRILRMIKEALDYARFFNSQAENDASVEPFFKIVNQLLKSEYGVLDQQVGVYI